MAVSRKPREEVGADVRLADYPVLRLPPEQLDDLIETHGIGAILRRSILCPCVRSDTKSPRSGCTICRGIGFAYPPDLEEPVIVFVLSRNARQRALTAGRHYDGTAEVTFPSGIIPARGDMLLPDGEVHTVNEVLHRQNLEIDVRAMRRQVTDPDAQVPMIPVPSERLLYPDVASIEYVTWYDRSRPEGEQLVTAVEGDDYTVDGPRITWLEGHGPGVAGGYSVRYRAPAAYLIADAAPVHRSESTKPIPHKATVSRLDRWGEPDVRGTPS